MADIIGAFAAGLIVTTTPKGAYTASKFNPWPTCCSPLCSLRTWGLKVELPKMDAFIVMFTVMLVVVGIGSKLIGCGLGAKIFGFKGRQCVQIGCGMACRGEVALIVANKGMAMNIINPIFFGPIIILVVCCAVFTPHYAENGLQGRTCLRGYGGEQAGRGLRDGRAG